MNKKSLSILGVGMLVGVIQFLSLNTDAALLAHFKLEEGSIDPFTNTVNSFVSTNTGTFSVATPPTWGTTGLAPIPASEGGTTAHVDFSTTATSYILTDYYGPTGSVKRTVAAWVKFPTAFQTGGGAPQGCIVSYGSTAANTYRFTLTLDSTGSTPKGKLRFEIAGANMVGNTVVADGNWHHVAMTCPDNARMSNVVLYVDGNRQALAASANLGNLLNTSASGTIQPVNIGVSIHSAGPCWGSIDDVRVYDTQLTDSEILQLVYGAGTAPSIGQQPANAQAILGTTNTSISFSVGLGAGSPPISYQWKRGGVNIPGATGQILTISPVTAADIASYSVGVTNPYGGVLSTAATLSWATPPPNPVEQTVLIGSNAIFTATMPAESAGYTYQWRKGGGDISGATTSAYIIPSAILDDAGNYSVRVELAGQSAISAAAPLNVLSLPSSPYARQVLGAGAIAYWRLGEVNGATVATDATGFHPGYFSNFFGTELQVTGALTNDANTAAQFGAVNHVEASYSPALQRDGAYSLEAWVKPEDASGRHSVICERSRFLSRGYELASAGAVWQFRTGNQDNSINEIWNDLSGGTVTIGQWHHLVATYDGTTKRLYVNGELVGTQTIVAKGTVDFPFRIGAGLTYTTPGDYFSGTIDEVAIYWRALSADEVAIHHSLGAFGSSVAPFLLSDISSRTNYVGAYVTFRVSAQGSYPLSYQWLKNGTNLPGATTGTLTLPRIQVSDAGTYALNVSNQAGSTNTTTATLTVLPITQAGYRGLIMGDGPVAYYPLDELNYNPIAAELLNFGLLDGIYSGSPLEGEAGATTATGTSVLFDGTSQAVLLSNPDVLNISGQVSLEAWIKPLTNYASGGFGNIIAHGFGGSPSRELVLRVSSGQYQMHTYDGTTYGVNLPVPGSDIGNWVHLVGTYDGSYWRIYRNGALAAASSSSVGAFAVNAEWAIGARGGGTERFFNGGIDEVAIYPYALGGDQVGKHYFAATGQTGQLGISKSGANVVLTWNAGLLEEAANVTGPWTTVTNAVSPLTVPATAAQGYYRLRW